MKSKTSYAWIELVLGILLAVLGIYTLINPDTAFGGVVIAYGLLAVLCGIADIALYVIVQKRTKVGPVISLVGGIFSVIAGLLVLFFPQAGAWALTILFPIWFMMHCIAGLCKLNITKFFGGTAAFVVSLIANILGVILSFMILFNPWASALSLVYFVGFYLILLGAEAVVVAVSLFSSRGGQSQDEGIFP